MKLSMTQTERGYRLTFEKPTGPNTSDVVIRNCPTLKAAIREIQFHMGEQRPRRRKAA